MSEARHEGFGECWVSAERGLDARLRINPNTGGSGSDGIAVVGFYEKRRLREKLAPTGGMQNDEMVIDGAADEAWFAQPSGLAVSADGTRLCTPSHGFTRSRRTS